LVVDHNGPLKITPSSADGTITLVGGPPDRVDYSFAADAVVSRALT
jgi:hypothetical protein